MSRHTRLLLPLTALLLAGCAASSRPEPTRVLLSYDGPAPQASAAVRTLVVRSVGVPDYLDRRGLVQRRGAEVQEVQDALWAERLSKSVTRYVTQSLAAQRPDYAVQALTTASGIAPDLALTLVVDRFESVDGGALQLRGSYSLTEPGRILGSGRFDADAPVVAGGAASQVHAMQQALNTACAALAKALPATR